MMPNRIVFASLLVLMSGSAFAVVPPDIQRSARPISDVIENAKRRDKVVIEGKVQRPFDFDTFLISDGTEEIAVSFFGLKQHLGAGDKVTVYGRYDGRRSYKTDFALINVLEWAPSDQPAAAELKQRYGYEAPPAPPPSSPIPAEPPPPPPSIENRLRQLDELKTKGLVTPEEYNQQRKRILNDL